LLYAKRNPRIWRGPDDLFLCLTRGNNPYEINPSFYVYFFFFLSNNPGTPYLFDPRIFKTNISVVSANDPQTYGYFIQLVFGRNNLAISIRIHCALKIIDHSRWLTVVDIYNIAGIVYAYKKKCDIIKKH